MAWYDPRDWSGDDWSRIGLGVATGGLSEVGRAIRGQPSIYSGITDKVGLTVSDPSGSPEYQQLAEAAKAFQTGYQGAGSDVGQTRSMDLGTIAMLRDAAEGRAPSAAESLMQRNVDTNARQALGLASTLGGYNPGMALRAGLSAYSDAGARSAADVAALRAAEMAANREALSRATGAAATRDVQRENSLGGLYAQTVGAPYAAKERAAAANQAAVGNAFATGGKIFASDERLKTNITDGSQLSDEFLQSLDPRAFEYRTPGPNEPPGQRLGVMAQDLPRHDVVTGPDGKKWVSATAISDMLAGMGRLHERLSAVEGGRSPTGGTAVGTPDQYRMAMDYMTAPRRDAGTAGRVAAGMPPGPRAPAPDDVQLQEPDSYAQFLRSLGFAY